MSIYLAPDRPVYPLSHDDMRFSSPMKYNGLSAHERLALELDAGSHEAEDTEPTQRKFGEAALNSTDYESTASMAQAHLLDLEIAKLVGGRVFEPTAPIHRLGPDHDMGHHPTA